MRQKVAWSAARGGLGLAARASAKRTRSTNNTALKPAHLEYRMSTDNVCKRDSAMRSRQALALAAFDHFSNLEPPTPNSGAEFPPPPPPAMTAVDSADKFALFCGVKLGFGFVFCDNDDEDCERPSPPVEFMPHQESSGRDLLRTALDSHRRAFRPPENDSEEISAGAELEEHTWSRRFRDPNFGRDEGSSRRRPPVKLSPRPQGTRMSPPPPTGPTPIQRRRPPRGLSVMPPSNSGVVDYSAQPQRRRPPRGLSVMPPSNSGVADYSAPPQRGGSWLFSNEGANVIKKFQF